MRPDELRDLLKVVEEVRAEVAPGLSPDLVREIVEIESEHVDDGDAAQRAIRDAIQAIQADGST